MSVSLEKKRVNITLPATLLAEFRTLVPRQERNQFIAAALERAVRRLKLQQALQQTAGAWQVEDHPELATSTDIETYLRELRAGYMPRSWDELTAGSEDDA